MTMTNNELKTESWRWLQHVRGVALGSALALVGACALDDSDAGLPADEGNTSAESGNAAIAHLEVDGVTIDFYEPQPGELTTVSMARSVEELELMRELEDAGLAPLAVFEALSDEEPPIALVEAAARAAAAEEASRSQMQPIDGSASSPEKPTSLNLTASQFQASYCATSSYWNFKYCWLNVSGYTWVDWWCSRMYTYVNTTLGVAELKVRTFQGLWWNESIYPVPAGMILRASSTGSWTQRRHEVRPLGTARYHRSTFGRI